MNLLDIVSKADPEQIEALEEYQEKNIPAFLALNEQHPLSHKYQYVSLSESFWLYHLAHDIQYVEAAESGTMDGYSAWWISQASTGIFRTYDPNTHPLIPHSWEHLTTDFQFSSSPTNPSFVFFDDHVSPARRLLQAKRLGFQHVCIHDVYPISDLWGCPALQGALVFQFPRIRHPPIFRSPNLSAGRWLTYIQLPGA